jgi:hypothetical protein
MVDMVNGPRFSRLEVKVLGTAEERTMRKTTIIITYSSFSLTDDV